MSKTLEESKRSIQSTRIDVIAGDPMPIKPLDSLPINTVLRPKVEDPEYKPDTASELAAALSALARLVPPEQASSIYIAIRELIEKIVPITHTSMDMIGEGKFTALDDDLEERALKIRIEVEKRVADLRRQNSDYADAVVERLNDFGAKLYALIRSAAPAKGKPSPTERELRPIVVALNNMVSQYEETLRGETSISPPGDLAAPSQVSNPNTKFDAINKGQIIDAFRRRITALQSSGDSFDMQVARATERRMSIVTEIMGRIKLDVARPVEPSSTAQQKPEKTSQPARPAQTAPAAPKPEEKITRWIFNGSEEEVIGEAIEAIKANSYLLIRYTAIDSETGERSDQFRFVSPSKVAKKETGESVLIAKDVSGDFDLFYETEEKEHPIVKSGTLLTFAFDRIAYAQLIEPRLVSAFWTGTKIALQEAAQPADKISPLEALYAAVTSRLNERNKNDHSHFSMRFTPRSGAPSGFYDIFLLPEFVPGRIREYPATDEVRYDPDSEKSELILGHGHVHVYRRFIQTFDGKDIEIQPDVRVDLSAIARDFIIAAADDLRRQDVDDAEKQAADFFEENRYYIIKDAINPTRVPDPQHPDEDRAYRAMVAAFNVANQYVDKTFSIDSIDRAEATSKWSLDKLSSVARSFESVPSGPTSDEALDRAQRLRGSVKEMERQVAAIARGKYEPSDRSSFGRLKPARLEEQRIAKIRRELRSLMSTGQGPIAVELAMIENASFESFSAVSSLDSKKLAEMTRNFDVSTMHPISRIPQPTPPARIDAAGQRVAAFIAEAKKSTTQISDQMKDALRADLLTALRSLAEARRQAADRGISAAQTTDPMFIDDLEEKHKDLAAAVAKLREISQTVSAASAGRIKTLEAAIDLFGQVAQLAPNNEPFASNLEDLRSATRLVAKGSIQRVIETVLDEDGFPNSPEIGGASTGLTSDTEEQHLLSLVGAAASILQRSFPGKRPRDLIGSDGAGPAFVFFGCTIDKQMPPIFAQGSLTSLLEKSSLVKEQYLAVLSPHVGEALFNLSPGTLQRMSDTLASSKPDDAANSALAFSEALFRDAIGDALGDSFPVFEGLRLVVYLACHLVESGFKNTQTTEEIARNRVVDSIEDALIAGSYGTRIDINSLTGKAFSQYSVSVDQQEPGVGFFVDAAGLPVARVVGGVSADILNREDSAQMRNHTRNASLMFAGTLVCIDPRLTRMAQSAFDTIVASTGDTLKESVNIKDDDIVELISDSARDAILAQMQKSAARVNSSLSINPTERYIEDMDAPRTVKDFIEHNKKIMGDARRTNLARMVAAAAISYVGHTQKLPEPGMGIQYYTRIKTDDHTDPETGMPLLKQGHDFVLKTLPASVKHPSLGVYRGELTTSRERFLSTIMQLVDDHILTELHDPFGVIKPFVQPLEDIERSEKSKDKGKKKKKDPRMNAFNYVQRVLLPDQAANALTIVQGEVRRSPFQLRNLPVLSVTSVIKSGMSPDELNRVFADARNFVVGMMLERGLGGGYIRTDTKLTESQIRDLPSNSEAAQNILSDVGEEILRAVQNHVAEKVHAAEGGTGITVGQGDDEERLTQSQVAGRVSQTSRAAIISRIAAEHHRALGLEDPVQLFYDKKTGLPSTPPDPVEFFRARGVKTAKEARIADPVQHAMQLSIAYDEYRKHISEMLGISPPSMGGFIQGQVELAKRFPEILSDAKEKAQLESVDNKYTYVHEPISTLDYDATAGTIVEIEGTVGQDESERRDIVKKLARMQAIFERDQAAVNRFETYSSSSRFARVFASVWPNITRQISNARVFVDSFEKQVEKIAASGAETSMDRMPPEMSRTLLSLSVAYNTLAATFNFSCANNLQQLENEARIREAAKITSENIVSACQRELNRLRASGEREKFSSLLKIVESMGIAASDDKTTITLAQPKQDEEAEEKRDASGLPTLTGTDASTLIDELSKWRSEQVKSITKAYEKSSKAAGVAHEHIDAEIRIMARQLAPDVSRVLGAKVKPEVRIFETMDDLVSFANEIAADHTSALLRHLKDVQSERAREQINASVKSYLSAALGGTLYAVRVPPNRADDADAS